MYVGHGMVQTRSWTQFPDRSWCSNGSLTGKALDFTTRNKFCRTCQSDGQTGGNPKPHDCRDNHQTSSKSMEPLSAVELFRRAPVQSNCPAKYEVFIGDDDCSTLSKIREVVYAIEFIALHHIGHLPMAIANTMVLFNSAINPFVYALLNKQFREKMKVMLCCTQSSAPRVHSNRKSQDTVLDDNTIPSTYTAAPSTTEW